MLICEKAQAAAVFRFADGEHRLRLSFPTDSIARVTYTGRDAFLNKPSRIVSWCDAPAEFEVREEEACFRAVANGVSVEVAKATGALRYFGNDGRLLFAEPERGGRWLTAKSVTRNVFARQAAVDTGQNVDGARVFAREYETVVDREAYEAKLEFVFQPDEALFGLGSHEEGYGNLRGRMRELYQQNMKAVVPFFQSTRGYGVLLDCGSLMMFHDDALGSYWWADVVDELDYYVIAGEDSDGVVRGYRGLTGRAPMLPKWALGFVQSKERYVNAAELVAVVKEHRRRKVPLDVIVLDWKSWPNGAGWGQKSFDPARFADPDAMTRELHAMGARLMVSVWPIMTGGCANQQELLERDLMLGNQATYNAFLKEARECYWKQAERGLFAHGVDAWWCDCTEPFEADWSGAVMPEAHVRLGINTAESKRYLNAAEINAYSLVHSQGIYEGQRSAKDAKRVVNLTRSSYAGQHRYGTITWNGDICGTWETLRRCIPEGVNFCSSGEPYWTVDAGGFFLQNDAKLWFWRGDFDEGCRGLTAMDAMEPDAADTGCTDLGFWELYTRWMQYAAFLPMFRSHGTDAAREIWRFGEEGTPFYDAIAEAIRLRYRLMPYLYSLAAEVTRKDASMMRCVALEFPADTQTHGVTDEFLLGRSLLVCPVTRPMLYGPGSTVLRGVEQTREVYLPAGAGWFDFWTNRFYAGGQVVVAVAPLERIPVFVRAGSIVPMTDVMQYADEVKDAPYEVRVYAGADAEFELYEDSGDGYAYERGESAVIRMEWKDGARKLRLAAAEGDFPERVKKREVVVRVFGDGWVDEKRTGYAGEEVWVEVSTGGQKRS